MALTGLLTIYVALIGYRLLLGGDVTVRDGLAAALKVGVVLALATQWPAWRVLVYDVATKAPEGIAAGFLAPAGLASGGSPGLAARIDGVSAALAQMVENAAAAKASGQPAAAPLPQRPTTMLSEPAARSLASATAAMATSALAGMLAVRVITALLLALGPVFIACLLFEATRGFFAGWLRVLAGAMAGALAVPVVLALELALVEPQVLALRGLIDANQPVAALPQQIFASAVIGALLMLAALVAMARVGLGFALPHRRVLDLGKYVMPERQLALPPPDWAIAGRGGEERSRAQRIADAAQSLTWREERLGALAAPPMRLALPHPASGANDSARPGPAPLPLGQSGRRTLQRQSVGARRRDDMP